MFPLHKKNSMKKWFKSYSLCTGCNSVCVFQLNWIKVHYIFQYTFILFNYYIYHCKLRYISSTGPYFKQLYNVQYTCNADYITQNGKVILIKEYKNSIRLVFRPAIVSKLYTAWNTAIRILFDVPRDTHRYLIESFSQCLHVKTMLASKCVSFYETIEASSFLNNCFRVIYN